GAVEADVLVDGCGPVLHVPEDVAGGRGGGVCGGLAHGGERGVAVGGGDEQRGERGGGHGDGREAAAPCAGRRVFRAHPQEGPRGGAGGVRGGVVRGERVVDEHAGSPERVRPAASRRRARYRRAETTGAGTPSTRAISRGARPTHAERRRSSRSAGESAARA